MSPISGDAGILRRIRLTRTTQAPRLSTTEVNGSIMLTPSVFVGSAMVSASRVPVTGLAPGSAPAAGTHATPEAIEAAPAPIMSSSRRVNPWSLGRCAALSCNAAPAARNHRLQQWRQLPCTIVLLVSKHEALTCRLSSWTARSRRAMPEWHCLLCSPQLGRRAAQRHAVHSMNCAKCFAGL